MVARRGSGTRLSHSLAPSESTVVSSTSGRRLSPGRDKRMLSPPVAPEPTAPTKECHPVRKNNILVSALQTKPAMVFSPLPLHFVFLEEAR